MADMRIRYDEEMVGAGHPTKADTLNRLALVEADIDGHGRWRYLKAQSSAPSTGEEEGVLYTQVVGGALELMFRGPADGAPRRLTLEGKAAAQGFITGMYPIYKDGSSVNIAPGVVELGGQGFNLPSAVTLTPTLTASSWHYIYVSAIPASTTLTASDFIVSPTAPTRSAEGWYDAQGNRCVGFFYADSTPAIINFSVEGGLWGPVGEWRLVDTTAAPTTATLLSVGPAVPSTIWLNVYAVTATWAVQVHLYSSVMNPATGTLITGSGGATSAYLASGSVPILSADGTIYYYASASYPTTTFRLRLVGIVIPHGMGRR